MDKVIAVLIILLFTVTFAVAATFSSDGVHTDAMQTRDNTKTIVSNANSQLMNLGGNNGN